MNCLELEEKVRLESLLKFVSKLNELLLKYQSQLRALTERFDCDRNEVDLLDKQYQSLIKEASEIDLDNSLNTESVENKDVAQEQEKSFESDLQSDLTNSLLNAQKNAVESKTRRKTRASGNVLPKKVSEGGTKVAVKKADANKLQTKRKEKQSKEQVKKQSSVAKKIVSYQKSGVKVIEINTIAKSQNKNGILSCTYSGCDWSGVRQKDLTDHLKTHPCLKYVCEECGRSYTNKRIYNEHVRNKHGKVRPFKCSFEGCEKTFVKKSLKDTHEKMHLKLFSCDWPGCDVRGATAAVIACHRRLHTGEKPFKCCFEGCDKSFVSNSRLNSHKIKHSEERKFNCPWPGCDLAFKTRVHLKKHIPTHGGECAKTFACDWPGCEFRGINRGRVLAHKRRIHENIKNFRCTWPECKKKFYTKMHLKEHLCIHTGQRPVACAFAGCEKRFIIKSNMWKHYRNMHDKDRLIN